jgi:ankyrin repeat protein
MVGRMSGGRTHSPERVRPRAGRRPVILGCALASIPFLFVLALATLGGGLGLSATSPRLTKADAEFLTAARRGDLAGLRAGLARGVAVDVREPVYHRTALMRASAFDQPEAVRLLLGARADVRAKAQNFTALHIAAEAGAARVIPLLCTAGSDLNDLAPGAPAARTPLSLAVGGDHVEAASALLLAGANPDLFDPTDEKPIEAAIRNRRPELVKALIASGASLTPSPAWGAASLLHYAVQRCAWADLETVRTLVSGGADTTVRDRNGHVPLQAIENQDPHWVDVTCYPPIAAYLGSVRKAR